MVGSTTDTAERHPGHSVWYVLKLLHSAVRSNDPDVQTAIYFSLFLVVFPVVVIVWDLLSGQIMISIPLVLMFCCGLLSFRAARAIENRRGS